MNCHLLGKVVVSLLDTNHIRALKQTNLSATTPKHDKIIIYEKF